MSFLYHFMPFLFLPSPRTHSPFTTMIYRLKIERDAAAAKTKAN
jgi:hypothetical protein